MLTASIWRKLAALNHKDRIMPLAVDPAAEDADIRRHSLVVHSGSDGDCRHCELLWIFLAYAVSSQRWSINSQRCISA
ncbi:hypothetical protein JCM19000A_07150 [Silvimonas sp. JCM 19000]